MPRYKLHLHDGPVTPVVTEVIDVQDDEDAKDLARITLLMTKAYTHAEVYRGRDLVGTCKRDSYGGET
ncbi:hypothetical protein [Brevundimonas sp.]|uniref:hypothetical protein n=1 Tax=Brevundimonas sp. TaxID=1871086 RepID=UPI002D447AF2|nr:hypothetical protein [Brevundimonas sp.]HYC96868.1 hypothetical protein [Brevundimonas sp.]